MDGEGIDYREDICRQAEISCPQNSCPETREHKHKASDQWAAWLPALIIQLYGSSRSDVDMQQERCARLVCNFFLSRAGRSGTLLPQRHATVINKTVRNNPTRTLRRLRPHAFTRPSSARCPLFDPRPSSSSSLHPVGYSCLPIPRASEASQMSPPSAAVWHTHSSCALLETPWAS